MPAAPEALLTRVKGLPPLASSPASRTHLRRALKTVAAHVIETAAHIGMVGKFFQHTATSSTAPPKNWASLDSPIQLAITEKMELDSLKAFRQLNHAAKAMVAEVVQSVQINSPSVFHQVLNEFKEGGISHLKWRFQG